MSDNISSFSQEDLRKKIHSLRVEHRELDTYIVQLEKNAPGNHFEIRRLKKRKLHLKDAITMLESELIPDLNA